MAVSNLPDGGHKQNQLVFHDSCVFLFFVVVRFLLNLLMLVNEERKIRSDQTESEMTEKNMAISIHDG